MGVEIYLLAADSLTQEEWEPAYEKSLDLAQYMGAADLVRETYRGIPYTCLEPVRETVQMGSPCWSASADIHTMQTAERNVLYRRLPLPGTVSGADVLFSALGTFPGDRAWKPLTGKAMVFWGGKTMGHNVHLCLLAVACLLEDLLPGKVTCAGDITRGQYRMVMPSVSRFLGRPVAEPVRCSLPRLWERICAMPLPEEDRVPVLSRLFLGEQDAEYGAFLREHVSPDLLDAFWKSEFSSLPAGSRLFRVKLRDCLTQGFSVRDLGKYISFTGKDGESACREFVLDVLDTEMHVRVKDCSDPARPGMDEQYTYGLGGQAAMMFYPGGCSPRVDRFIPLDSLLEELEDCVGDRCSVRDTAAAWLKEHGQTSAGNSGGSASEDSPDAGDAEDWDIRHSEDLLQFRKGDTVIPALAAGIRRYFDAHRRQLRRGVLREGFLRTPEEQFAFLLTHIDPELLLAKSSWDRIRRRLQENPRALERYGPVVFADLSSREALDICRAVMVNDDFYAWCLKNKDGREEDPDIG